jgi:hypothetical protein
MLLAFFLVACYFTYRAFKNAKRTGRYAIRFHISTEGIERLLPDGRSLFGRWRELEYVRPGKRILYFKDGTEITLNYGPNALRDDAELTPDELQAVVLASGGDSILSKAVSEFTDAAPSKARGWVAGLYICLIIMPIILGAESVYQKLEEPVSVYASTAIGLIGLLLLVPMGFFLYGKKYAVDRKYRPPQDKSG